MLAQAMKLAAAIGIFGAALGLALAFAAEPPNVSGKITGGFQAPVARDTEGRRSVLKQRTAPRMKRTSKSSRRAAPSTRMPGRLLQNWPSR
jgi:hypothetical protein